MDDLLRPFRQTLVERARQKPSFHDIGSLIKKSEALVANLNLSELLIIFIYYIAKKKKELIFLLNLFLKIFFNVR